MKTLKNVQVSVVSAKLTLTADVTEINDADFRFPIQRVTVGYLNPENLKWPRHIQISGEAFFVKAYGSAMVISHDDVVKLAVAVEPKTSFAPVFKKPLDKNLSADVLSELPVTYQWQSSNDVTSWTNIEYELQSSLQSAASIQDKFVRLIVTNAAGSTGSNIIQIK